MAVYKLGSRGDAVVTIQRALAAAQLYMGPLDGIYGGGTQSAVRAFQTARGLTADGIVGPATWAALVPATPAPEPPKPSGDLAERCLALVGTFETGARPPDAFVGLSGDFDGQGMSFGALQWAMGQGSLQPLLKRMDARHADIVTTVFGEQAAAFRAMLAMDTVAEQVEWAQGIQSTRHVIQEPWQGCFKTLGRRPEYQAIQVAAAGTLFAAALDLCRTFGLKSERAAALMFSIKVQNGSISAAVRAQIQDDFTTIDPADEVARLRAVAIRRAAAANPRWQTDVRTRLLTIAEGHGTVHGLTMDLEADYGIGMGPI